MAKGFANKAYEDGPDKLSEFSQPAIVSYGVYAPTAPSEETLVMPNSGQTPHNELTFSDNPQPAIGSYGGYAPTAPSEETFVMANSGQPPHNELTFLDDPPPEYSSVTNYQPIMAPSGYAYPPPLLPYPEYAAIAAAADYQDMAQKAQRAIDAHSDQLMQQSSALCCINKKYLDDVQGNDVYLSYIEKNKRSLPQIVFHIQCFHYEHRTEYYRDSNGNEKTRHIKNRVDTHRATKYLRYSQCWDFTKYPSAIDCGADFARVQFVKEYSFKDESSKEAYERQKVSFITLNDRDKFYDFSEEYKLSGFREMMTVKLTENETPMCMSPWCCCLASMFCGCMCYTNWFHKNTVKLYALSLKVIQINSYW